MLDPDEPDDHLAVLPSPAVVDAAAAIERHAIEAARYVGAAGRSRTRSTIAGSARMSRC